MKKIALIPLIALAVGCRKAPARYVKDEFLPWPIRVIPTLGCERFPYKYPFVGTWQDYHVFTYTAELTLNADGRFTFHDEGCLGKGFSEGYWEEVDGLISLKSYEWCKDRGSLDFTRIDTMYFDQIYFYKKDETLFCVDKKTSLGTCIFERDPSSPTIDLWTLAQSLSK